jgi:pyrroline-5-carboxylate reductase
MKTLILGAGKMVEAILVGLKEETDLSNYILYSPSGESAKKLAQSIGCRYVLCLDEVREVDFVWLGCKPQQLKALASSISGKFKHATFVSLLAAVPEVEQLKILAVNKLVRVMPNLPVKFKRGVTLLSSSSAKEDLKKVKSLFSLLGLAHEVMESELDELTLLTGSGPALFYEFTKCLFHSFSSLAPAEREKLSRMVLQGAGEAVAIDDNDLDVMINAVTSKGGVTIAVLENWRKNGMDKLISDGVRSGLKRSEEIKDSLLHN